MTAREIAARAWVPIVTRYGRWDTFEKYEQDCPGGAASWLKSVERILAATLLAPD